jgi:hypothetical protein
MAARTTPSTQPNPSNPPTPPALTGYEAIWLEVSNVRLFGTEFQVQLRADREPERPRWWPLPGTQDKEASAQFKAVSESLEKKRPVLAELVSDTGQKLKVNSLAIQYAETSR